MEGTFKHNIYYSQLGLENFLPSGVSGCRAPEENQHSAICSLSMNLLSLISRCNEFETLGELGENHETWDKYGNTEIHSRSWEYIGEKCEKQGWIWMDHILGKN